MLRILLVEDNPGDQRLFKDALDEAQIKHEIEIVSNSSAAVDAIYGFKPNVIMMDIMIPRVTGDNLVKLLQVGTLSTSTIPVVFITGKKMDQEVHNELNVGHKTYPLLNKPVDSNELKQILSKIFPG